MEEALPRFSLSLSAHGWPHFLPPYIPGMLIFWERKRGEGGEEVYSLSWMAVVVGP